MLEHVIHDPVVQEIFVGVILAIVAVLIARIDKKINEDRTERIENSKKSSEIIGAIKECVACMSRMQLVDAHDKYVGMGYMPDADRQAVSKLHKSYEVVVTNNGIIDGYMEDLRELPTVKPKF